MPKPPADGETILVREAKATLKVAHDLDGHAQASIRRILTSIAVSFGWAVVDVQTVEQPSEADRAIADRAAARAGVAPEPIERTFD